MKRTLIIVGIIAAASLGCSKIKEVKNTAAISMDIALEDQQMLLDKYTDPKCVGADDDRGYEGEGSRG